MSADEQGRDPSDPTVEILTERLAVLHQRIESAGGSPDTTRILAVTKTFPAAVAELALDAGLFELGENYGQELERKGALIQRPEVRWHFIGGLQRNKVKRIAELVSVWQTVDRLELASEIAKRAPGAAVMLQVNTTHEAQKSGCPPAETGRLLEHCRQHDLDVRGLMTIGPTDGSDPAPSFSRLRQLGEDLGLAELSMGMSGDLEIAVAEGSTMIRVGTGLFGPRPTAP